MRPTRVIVVGAVTAVVTGAGVTTAVVLRGGDEKVTAPVLAFEQTDKAVILRIRNVNKHWGLRHQRVEIAVHREGAFPRFYGPDQVEGYEGRPELGEFRCCEITELRPGGDFTFTLFLSKYRVTGIDVDLSGGPGWIRM